MGTFIGHIVPGLSVALLGLWHTVNTIRSYILQGSSSFTVRFWYKITYPFSKFKYLELILIFSFSLLSILMQVSNFPVLDFSFNLTNFEHAAMFLHLSLFSGFTLLSELIHSSKILSRVSGILLASVFGQELFLLHFHSADHVGIEGHYHLLLQVIVFGSFVSASVSACFPTSFPTALVVSILVVFQGFWFVNMGFMLWVPKFVPKGCNMRLVENRGDEMLGAVICGSNEADLRARALANLQFSLILGGIFVLVGFIALKLGMSEKCSTRDKLTDYEKLIQSGGVEVSSVSIDGLKEVHTSNVMC